MVGHMHWAAYASEPSSAPARVASSVVTSPFPRSAVPSSVERSPSDALPAAADSPAPRRLRRFLLFRLDFLRVDFFDFFDVLRLGFLGGGWVSRSP